MYDADDHDKLINTAALATALATLLCDKGILQEKEIAEIVDQNRSFMSLIDIMPQGMRATILGKLKDKLDSKIAKQGG